MKPSSKGSTFDSFLEEQGIKEEVEILAMKKSPKKLLDVSRLSPATQERIERALKPRRDKVLSLRFTQESIDRWKNAMNLAGESQTDWVQKALDRAAALEEKKAEKLMEKDAGKG